MAFVEAVLESARSQDKWTVFPVLDGGNERA
jgi:hypothetical protein